MSAETLSEFGLAVLDTLDMGKRIGDMTQPIGGYKRSGHARDKCVESLPSYTQGKSAWIRLAG